MYNRAQHKSVSGAQAPVQAQTRMPVSRAMIKSNQAILRQLQPWTGFSQARASFGLEAAGRAEPVRQPTATYERRFVNHESAPAIKIAECSQPFMIQRKGDDDFTPVDAAGAAEKLKVFDQTVAGIADTLKSYQGPEAMDFTEALSSLQAKRKEGKIVFGVQAGSGTDYASFDGATGQIRIYVNRGNVEASGSNLIHEAIHSVHAARFPTIAEKYAQVLAAGGTPDPNLGYMLLKWKAWTEYWAYRREYEYANLNRPADAKLDINAMLRNNKGVTGPIQKVVDATGKPFDPSTWNPPSSPQKTNDKSPKP